VSGGHQEVKGLFVAKNGGPSKRGVATRPGVWIAHVCSLYQTLDNEEVVLYEDRELRTSKENILTLDRAAQTEGGILLRHGRWW
jgi:hypothetical protein